MCMHIVHATQWNLIDLEELEDVLGLMQARRGLRVEIPEVRGAAKWLPKGAAWVRARLHASPSCAGARCCGGAGCLLAS